MLLFVVGINCGIASLVHTEFITFSHLTVEPLSSQWPCRLAEFGMYQGIRLEMT